jgi:hypothetical protein
MGRASVRCGISRWSAHLQQCHPHKPVTQSIPYACEQMPNVNLVTPRCCCELHLSRPFHFFRVLATWCSPLFYMFRSKWPSSGVQVVFYVSVIAAGSLFVSIAPQPWTRSVSLYQVIGYINVFRMVLVYVYPISAYLMLLTAFFVAFVSVCGSLRYVCFHRSGSTKLGSRPV